MPAKPAFSAALIAVSAILMASCSDGPARSTPELANSGKAAGVATAILNAGVMTQVGAPSEAGADGAKFLFDPLYDDHFGSLEELPPELIEAIVAGTPPYDGVDAVFVSHAHGDHFSASKLTRLLAAQDSVQLVAPEQALDAMREDAAWDDSFETRVRGIALVNGQASEAFELAGATVEAFRSPHGGWPDRHAGVHNITYRVSSPAEESMVGRVMHMGDADPAAEHYVALSDFLAAKRTGLAMVPHWFSREDDLAGLVGETLNSEAVVAMHVPANVPANLVEGELPYFSEAGEVLEIPATR